MKLTKQQESEIMPVYTTWWNSYLNGDVKTYDHYLDDDYRFVGSTEAEAFLNRRDTTGFFEATADQLAGKSALRNSILTAEYYDGIVFITELADAYLLYNEEWTFYGRFRFSSMLRKSKNGWRFIYQHFSTPDSKAQEGETIGLEKITAENLELRDAIKRRTVELEQKNRELQIEAALERVRARAMSMHDSSELADLVRLVFKELVGLDFSLTRCYIYIIDPESLSLEAWTFNTEIGEIPESYHIQYLDLPYYQAMIRAWKAQEKKLVYELSGEEKKETDRVLFSQTGYKNLPEVVKAGMASVDRVFLSFSFNQFGAIQTGGLKPLSDENLEIFNRFGKVFDLTYTRFNDLKQAEAQAREAQIEAALEKVRAKVMSMNSSKDLNETSLIFSEQLRKLGINWQFSYFWLIEPEKDENTFWITWPDNQTSTTSYSLAEADESFRECIIAWKEQIKVHSTFVPVQEVQAWLDTFDRVTCDAGGFAIDIMKADNFSSGVYYYDAMIRFGSFGILMNRATGDEEKNIQARFAKEFERAYTRFLDLQKAEAQAREMQIEAALEKVRNVSLAMQKSSELQNVVVVVFEKLRDLGLKFEDAGISIYQEGTKDTVEWVVAPGQLSAPVVVNLPFSEVDFEESEIFRDFWNLREKGKYMFNKTYSFAEKNKYFRYVGKYNDFSQVPEEVRKFQLEAPGYIVSSVAEKNSGIWVDSWSGQKITKDDLQVLVRVERVFEQAYTRFLDLQKAEAQAREAQIEAALEKVRSRSLSMHATNELGEVVKVIVEKLKDLDVVLDANGVIICTYFQDSRDVLHWIASPDFSFTGSYLLPYFDHPIFSDAWQSRLSGTAYFSKAYSIEEKNSFWEYAFEHSDYKYFPDDFKQWVFQNDKHVLSFAWQKNSAILIPSHTGITPSESEQQILIRFAKVFEQAYTRFLDLQKAEIQAREAVKQASLDRVRGEIASMRTKDDLNRITPLMWKELTALDVPFIRCGVFIMNEAGKKIQTYLSTPDGRSLTAFEMDFDEEGIAAGAVKSWREHTIYQDFWDKNQFLRFMQNLLDTGQITSSESFQGNTTPPESLYLNFVPFKQGMLYVGNISPLEQEALELVKALAESFSIAYARYEDFRHLEEAKNQVEKTLTELKAAQSQLIQSEKMASLGELTAGIAHEIQNPLNFVNNFSEVNSELIDELDQEAVKGNLEEVRVIAKDIKENEEKIIHHGKRADAIVKGMLQHSRTSNGQKESTDIKALADEYLRLSYHGLRAKDKSFNAGFRLEADDTIPEIRVTPQDIGRVLLNLINNAFYAVSEKAKKGIPDYKPQVVVSTGWVDGKVEIRVKDNGPGIPEQVRDKIFQPFFTTKPTGQGTGLGLSLSYDIVKAHGGELTMETSINKGTIFIIKLST
jgi:signal transduction histidine kinase